MDALALLDGHSSIVFANRAAERLFGHQIGGLDHLSLERVFSFRSPSEEEALRRRLEQRPGRAEIIAPFAVVGRRFDGSALSLTIDATDINVTDDETAPDRYVLLTLRPEPLVPQTAGMVADVTPERAMVERSEQQQRRLDLALQAGHLGIWELDTLTEEGWLDDRAKEMLGLSASEPADFAAIAARVHPDDQPGFAEQLKTGLTATGPIESLYRVAHTDGSYRWIRTAGIPFIDSRTDHLRVIAINRDETDLHENQQALADREQPLRLVLESTTTGVWDWDFEGQTISFSDNWLEFFGYSTAEIGGPGWEWSEIIHPDDWPKAERRLREHFEGTTETVTFECRVLGADSAWRWTRMRGQVIQRDSDGRPIRMLGVDTDITDERRMRSQLVHAGKMEALGVFAGGIAHDFNNILAIIRGQVSFVLRDQQTSPDTRKRLEAVDMSIDRSATLVRRLMLLGKPATDDPVHLDVSQYVADMRKVLDELIGESIVLRVETASTPLVVEIDASRFEALLLNLVANARDAMQHGGTLDISVRSLRGGSAVELMVLDNGIGMDAETLEACFDPYFTTKPPAFGTGLGMATSYRSVTMAGGTISASSTEGEGTEIRVEFATVSAKPTPPHNSPPAKAPRWSTAATILVVEDDRELLELNADLLRSVGHRVHEAFDAGSALDVLSQHGDVDLLITDVVLPGMNGADLATAATAAVPGLKTLFVSGFAPATPAISHIDRRNLLVKPVAAQDLLDAIAQRLNDA